MTRHLHGFFDILQDMSATGQRVTNPSGDEVMHSSLERMKSISGVTSQANLYRTAPARSSKDVNLTTSDSEVYGSMSGHSGVIVAPARALGPRCVLKRACKRASRVSRNRKPNRGLESGQTINRPKSIDRLTGPQESSETSAARRRRRRSRRGRARGVEALRARALSENARR